MDPQRQSRKKFKHDLTGMVFGKWTVLEMASDVPRKRYSVCICKCQCGNIKRVLAGNLVNGCSRGCRPCSDRLSRRNVIDFSGQKFGPWAAIRPHESKNYKMSWVCRHDDGHEEVLQFNRITEYRKPETRLVKNYRHRTWVAFKRSGLEKDKKTLDMIGCSGRDLANHLESQFEPGMTLENHGEWHIDHIRPISSFDLSDPEQVRVCFHYTNLQPLWKRDNLVKGSKTKPAKVKSPV